MVCGVSGFVKKVTGMVEGIPMKRAFTLNLIRLCCLIAVCLTAVLPATADEGVLLRFKHRPGEQYRIVGTNRQNVVVDGELVGTAEVLTRVQIEMLADREVRARYQVSEETARGGDLFQFDQEYSVTFHQDELGRQSVSRESFVPQVRDVPTLPPQPLLPGDTWTAPGIEVYDFRESLEIEQPVRIPVDVEYEFRGVVEFEGREYQEIGIRYNLFHRPLSREPESEEIRLMTARFSQQLLWDHVAGRPHYYEETYNLFVQFVDGTRIEYQGEADGRVTDAPDLDRDRVRDLIARAIIDENIADTTVRSDDEGVTIALEDIRFAPDSAELLDSELVKLDWVTTILEQYPDRDVLITGHTALAGTPEGRLRLSEERAAAVGAYLIAQGVRTRNQLMYRGRGAEDPVADNATFEGRRRNRRVEITIREN